MPQINLIQPGQPVADFAVSGTLVSIADVTVDTADHQSDAAETIEIRRNGESAQIGGTGAYLAHITVPPAQYSEPTYDQEPEEQGARERLPLDPNTIVITLWPTA